MGRRRKIRAKPEPLFSGYAPDVQVTARSRESYPTSRPAAVDVSAFPNVRPSAVTARLTAVDSDPEPQRVPRPSAPRGPATARRCAELLRLPARHVHALPAAWTMLIEACLVGNQCVPVVVTTCAPDYTRAQSLRYVTLHGAEWAAVVLAAELDRATPRALAQWCQLKQRDASWTLTPRTTLGAYIERSQQRLLNVGQVMCAYGMAILDVADANPASPDFWEVSHA